MEIHDSILDRLAKRALSNLNRINADERNLSIATRIAISKVKKSLRGGLSSMKARGVFVKDINIYSRRVIVKAKLVKNNNPDFKEKLRKHLEYITRDGAGEGEEKPKLFSGSSEDVNLEKLYDFYSKSTHNFRFIISPEDSGKIDLKKFTRKLVKNIEEDLKTKIDWVASIHYDTDNPHVHMVINGLDKRGDPLYIKKDYISLGIRKRASEVVQKKLGLRSWKDIIDSLESESVKVNKCYLDNLIKINIKNDCIDLSAVKEKDIDELPKQLIKNRLQYLESREIAKHKKEELWEISEDFIDELKKLSKINRVIQRLSKKTDLKNYDVNFLDVQTLGFASIEGRAIERSKINEFDEEEYLVIGTCNGKNYYIELDKYSENEPVKIGDLVRLTSTQAFSPPKESDSVIATEASHNNGIYDSAHHLTNLIVDEIPSEMTPEEYVQMHVDRLEYLVANGAVKKYSDGVVKKCSEGRYEISKDYIKRLEFVAEESEKNHRPMLKVMPLNPKMLKKLYLRRVIVKSRFKENSEPGPKEKFRKYLEYIAHNNLGVEGKKTALFSNTSESIDTQKIFESYSIAPNHFRFVISPEDEKKLNLKEYTRSLLERIGNELEIKMNWVASIRYDNDTPSIHMVVSGNDENGVSLEEYKESIIKAMYRYANEEINNSLTSRPPEETFKLLKLASQKSESCYLDDFIKKKLDKGFLDLNKIKEIKFSVPLKELLEDRLSYLEKNNIATYKEYCQWQVSDEFILKLKNINRIENIIKKTSEIIKVEECKIEFLDVEKLGASKIEGSVVDRARIDEIDDREYLIIKANEKYHYFELGRYSEKHAADIGDYVCIAGTQPFSGVKTSDRNIEREAGQNQDIYEAVNHLKNTSANVRLPPGVTTAEYVQMHVKRLELLVRHKIVEKLSPEQYLIPKDFIKRLESFAEERQKNHKTHIKVFPLKRAMNKKHELNEGLKPC
ncbi:MAG: DUF3363 domain-containing protein [Myxococcales bacterium]|nr:DUF3363 domain-containing protein [Myxococcales bacterium]